VLFWELFLRASLGAPAHGKVVHCGVSIRGVIEYAPRAATVHRRRLIRFCASQFSQRLQMRAARICHFRDASAIFFLAQIA
jgi:hypothetical protein